jgi:hypothetical protein
MLSQAQLRYNKPRSLSDLSRKYIYTALLLLSLFHKINLQIKLKTRSCPCA